uniref:Malonyl-CoA O-methyltransferase n=1 Tax=Candidatus Kentrum sp. FM TaxID=2126340 RepID=A0A450SLZ6_9GAMM|nr:MAG: malonyl-CoA O-methyltransferase [Candidatus Kentron sp. FM]VFJ75510.1 MAG: malonyl-CoA O-methyltransferase [Candidatus Kentron sp. FM]VFK09233.1 MAG: malonyl-CoA O-methyltransferase [Candidatus Kentron sp. FM]
MKETAIAKAFDDFAVKYHEMVGTAGDINHRLIINPTILSLIEPCGKTILDVGCGQGYFTNILADDAKEVVGIDISGEMIKLAHPKGQQSKFFVEDICTLDGYEEYFDIVIFNMSLMNILGPRRGGKSIL